MTNTLAVYGYDRPSWASRPIAEISLWLIYGAYQGNSSGGETAVWVLTSSMTTPPNVCDAIEKAAGEGCWWNEVHSIHLIGSTETPYGFNEIEKHLQDDYPVVNQSGYEMDDSVAEALKLAIIQKVS